MEEDLIPVTLFDDTKEFVYYTLDLLYPSLIENRNNVNISVPIWIAKKLQKLDLVAVEMPLCFSKEIVNQLDADPSHVDLFEIDPYFFEKAIHTKKKIYFFDGNEYIIEAARYERFKTMMDKAQFFISAKTKDFYNKLTFVERKEFDLKKKAEENYIQWKRCSTLKDFFKIK